MFTKIVLQWYRWQCSWAELIDGLIGIFTFGYVRLHLSLEAAKVAARKRYEYKN